MQAWIADIIVSRMMSVRDSQGQITTGEENYGAPLRKSTRRKRPASFVGLGNRTCAERISDFQVQQGREAAALGKPEAGLGQVKSGE